jgi:hypothetical protein
MLNFPVEGELSKHFASRYLGVGWKKTSGMWQVI